MVELYSVCIGTLVVFGFTWLSGLKFCECVVRCLYVQFFCREVLASFPGSLPSFFSHYVRKKAGQKAWERG